MLKHIIAALAVVLLTVQGVLAQQTKPTPTGEAEKPASAPAPSADRAQSVNVKLELTITDQSGPGAALKRTVSMIVADRQAGSIRSGGKVLVEGKGRYDATLNVDAEPWLLDDKRIRLRITLEYVPKPAADNAATGEGRAHLTERLGVIVESGKPLMLSHASDPTSDRKIAAELTATILR